MIFLRLKKVSEMLDVCTLSQGWPKSGLEEGALGVLQQLQGEQELTTALDSFPDGCLPPELLWRVCAKMGLGVHLRLAFIPTPGMIDLP
uniref:Uncharacterized protein n=1 Tax=Sphaerodactylus townsendi TaxID=933632 RepID=A0ACB8FAP8_9SAUR